MTRRSFMMAVCCALVSGAANGQERRAITVSGMVAQPGVISYREGMTLGEVISLAGGISEFGSKKRVTVIRGEETTRHDSTVEEGRSFALQPGDEVMVPQKTLCGDSGTH